MSGIERRSPLTMPIVQKFIESHILAGWYDVDAEMRNLDWDIILMSPEINDPDLYVNRIRLDLDEGSRHFYLTAFNESNLVTARTVVDRVTLFDGLREKDKWQGTPNPRRLSRGIYDPLAIHYLTRDLFLLR